MQLPIDVKKLVDEATSIDEARDTPVSLSVYIDGTAPADLVAHVRALFSSAHPSVRMTLSYLDEGFMPHPADDMAVVVAGEASSVGPAVAAIRAVGVPAMVVTTQPALVERTAESIGNPIPDGDIVAPDAPRADSGGIGGAVDMGAAPSWRAAEPIALGEEAAAQLDERIGAWIVSVCGEKCLALSIAFPFMRRALANDAVLTTSLQNAGIGLVPLIPGADLPIITLNQAKMVLQIAAAYGQPMGKDRYKELIATVVNAFLCRAIARELISFVPVLGFIIRPTIAFGATSALGWAVVEYYEGGENVAGFASVVSNAADAGKKLLIGAQGKVGEYAPTIAEKLEVAAPVVSEKAAAITPMLEKAIAFAFGKTSSASDAQSNAQGVQA